MVVSIKKRGLKLSETPGAKRGEAKPELILHIELNHLLPNPYQPATRFQVDPETARRFGRSFQEHGLIQLPVVRPGKEKDYFEIGDGWLRRAGYLFNLDNGLTDYASMPCQVKNLTDQQASVERRHD